MPLQPTYPGVYIEEVPSEVRTITGVATSITAFVGPALRGPMDKPVRINNFADFQLLFGGIWSKSLMTYAVRDFYLNGGSAAVIVRIAKGASKAIIQLPAGSPPTNLVLEAYSEGTWGNTLKVSIDHNTFPKNDASLFNLTVYEDVDGGSTETFLNVSVNEDEARYLPRVLDQNSLLLKVKGTMPSGRPIPTAPASPPSSPPSSDNSVGVTTMGNDGSVVTATEYQGDEAKGSGIHALKNQEFNLLCIPPPVRNGVTQSQVYVKALKLCKDSRAFLIVDGPYEWGDFPVPSQSVAKVIQDLDQDKLGLSTSDAINAAVFFPHVKQADPKREGQVATFPPCGIVAGVMARTDATRGVWKSPAGIDASLIGAAGLQTNLSDLENGQLNVLGVNCLRSFPVTGRVVWGARTLRGADQIGDQYKYIAVRRTALFIEESLYRGTKWVVFEPNDEPLWAQVRLNVGAFMHNLFRQGAFQGTSPRDAYLVKCDKETTTQNDINLGIVNILVGFASLKPAEFVMIKIQQLTGQIES